MAGIVIVIVNYFHDLAVAMLACSVLAVYLLGKWTGNHPDQIKFLVLALRRFSNLAYISLTYIIIGGAFRAYFFKEYEWSPAIEAGLVAALVVKHVILGTLTVIGLVVLIRYSRKYANNK